MQHITAKPIRTTNRNARQYVRNGVPFKNSNGQLFGKWETPTLFVVYSYGEHWPLFAWDGQTNEWLENYDKYSPTTSRHHTYAHPLTDTNQVSRTILKHIVSNRINEHWAAKRAASMAKVQSTLGLAA